MLLEVVLVAELFLADVAEVLGAGGGCGRSETVA